MRRSILIGLVVLAAGCGGRALPVDDAAVPADASTPPPPPLTAPADLSVPPDFGASPDLAALPDLGASPDLLFDPSPVVQTFEPVAYRELAAGEFKLAAMPEDGSYVAAYRLDATTVYVQELGFFDGAGLLARVGGWPSQTFPPFSNSRCCTAGDRFYFNNGSFKVWSPDRAKTGPSELGNPPITDTDEFAATADGDRIAVTTHAPLATRGSIWMGPPDGPLEMIDANGPTTPTFVSPGHLYFTDRSEVSPYVYHYRVIRLPAGAKPADAELECDDCRLLGFDETGQWMATARREEYSDDGVAVSATVKAASPPVLLPIPPHSAYREVWVNQVEFIPGSTRIGILSNTGTYENDGAVFDYVTGKELGDYGDACANGFPWMWASKSWVGCEVGHGSNHAVYMNKTDGTPGAEREDFLLALLTRDDKYLLESIGVPHGDYSGSILGLPGRGETVLPLQSKAPAAWVDDHRLLYRQNGDLALLDTTTWKSAHIAPGWVSDFIYDPVHSRVFYVVRFGASDGLFVAPIP